METEHIVKHCSCGCSFTNGRLFTICSDHAEHTRRIKKMATQIEREACARIAMQPWNWWTIAKRIRERGDGSPVY